jgi:hypothetical protein
MPRYFFHLQSDNVEVPDAKGREFRCVQDAHFHAQMIVRRTQPYLQQEDGRWSVRIEGSENDPEIIVLFPTRGQLENAG